jgi:folate-binding protein YgfZ
MNLSWQAFLESRGAIFDAGEAAHFGNPRAELAAVGEGAVLIPLLHFALIRAAGADAAAFLHSLFTNDVNHLPPDRAELNGFCSPKGRLLADFLMWREGNEEYLLRLAADLQPVLQKKLGMYLLRSKAQLSNGSEELVLLGVAGAGSATSLKALVGALPDKAYDLRRFSQGTLIRLGERQYQLAVRREAAEQVWETLCRSATPAGTPAWRWLDIAAGIPHITAATQEEFVPQMVNFELVDGVSFTKGCYPGQEVVARTKYLGKIKRRMYLAHVAGTCPAAGTDLFSPGFGDQACGKVVNSAPAPNGGSELLASMQISSAESGDVRVASAEGARLTLKPLPYAVA